jgi:hypothetical protein
MPFYGAGEGWRRSSEHISKTNEEILHRVKGEVDILRTKKQRRANWIDHIWCRNCLTKHVLGGKIEGPEDGGEAKQLLDGLMNVLELERGSTGDMESLIWKRLWTCCKAHCRTNERMNERTNE